MGGIIIREVMHPEASDDPIWKIRDLLHGSLCKLRYRLEGNELLVYLCKHITYPVCGKTVDQFTNCNTTGGFNEFVIETFAEDVLGKEF